MIKATAITNRVIHVFAALTVSAQSTVGKFSYCCRLMFSKVDFKKKTSFSILNTSFDLFGSLSSQ